jgi:hypothetical protein
MISSIFVYICEIKGVFFAMTNNSSVLLYSFRAQISSTRVTMVKAKSKTHESMDKDEAMKTETNTTRSTYEIKENTHKTKSK